ncbi:hypothetical protein [Engelhardtia mirabilis]|uniref:Uncharacterized protein n=1 Tax=Engelhardtia mirabilis TaxID=2528011 RepID=A0A518BG72_9BACT|nr:hypothetical protein Pla133_10500 [Planctomycetes bacterium Pla133]QDV00310.1 hypothetical protein Pla86_10490 [Planctomycetes bacterium Pla86]
MFAQHCAPLGATRALLALAFTAANGLTQQALPIAAAAPATPVRIDPLQQPGDDAEGTKPDRALEEVNDVIDDELREELVGVANGRLSRLFEGLELELITTAPGDTDRESGLGLRFELNKDLVDPLTLANGRSAVAFSLDARGQVFTEQRQNPFDFLEASLRASYFGRTTTSIETLDGLARAGDPDAVEKRYDLRADADELISQLSSDLGLTSLDAAQTPEFRRFVLENPTAVPPDKSIWAWHGDLRVGHESDQDFTNRQAVYGVELGGQLWSSDPGVAAWNLAEYPFALTRWLTGDDQPVPSMGPFPAINLGLDLVDPDQDLGRRAAGEDADPYPRLRAEVGYTSTFGTIQGRTLKASLDYRFYHELDASSGVSAADLDASNYFQFVLSDESGVYASYATGRLPFDVDDDSVFSVGFRLSR